MPFCSFSEGAAMFDVTPIENMFLLEYLPTAPEGFLRVGDIYKEFMAEYYGNRFVEIDVPAEDDDI